MKIQARFILFNFKAPLIITCIIIGFLTSSLCYAQTSVAGKWKVVSVKQFYTPEYAKQMGRAVIEGKQPVGSKYQWEFKADHTYVVDGGHGKSNITTGEWSVDGNKLIMKAAAQVRSGKGAQVYTFVITGNQMVRTEMTQPPYNDIVFKQEETGIRL